MSDETPLPKEQLLRKLLKMTTSENDGEALTAMRKANELMASAKWTWDMLLDQKIKIIESPFASVPKVNATRKEFVAPPPMPTTSPGVGKIWEWNSYDKQWNAVHDPNYYHKRPPMPSYSPGFGMRWVWDSVADSWRSASKPQPAPPPPPPQTAFGHGRPHGMTKANIYANSCYCCGDHVAVKTGWVFNPQQDYNTGPNKWEVMCEPCNKNGAHVPSTKARATNQPAGIPKQGTVNLGSL